MCIFIELTQQSWSFVVLCWSFVLCISPQFTCCPSPPGGPLKPEGPCWEAETRFVNENVLERKRVDLAPFIFKFISFYPSAGVSRNSLLPDLTRKGKRTLNDSQRHTGTTLNTVDILWPHGNNPVSKVKVLQADEWNHRRTFTLETKTTTISIA